MSTHHPHPPPSKSRYLERYLALATTPTPTAADPDDAVWSQLMREDHVSVLLRRAVLRCMRAGDSDPWEWGQDARALRLIDDFLRRRIRQIVLEAAATATTSAATATATTPVVFASPVPPKTWAVYETLCVRHIQHLLRDNAQPAQLRRELDAVLPLGFDTSRCMVCGEGRYVLHHEEGCFLCSHDPCRHRLLQVVESRAGPGPAAGHGPAARTVVSRTFEPSPTTPAVHSRTTSSSSAETTTGMRPAAAMTTPLLYFPLCLSAANPAERGTHASSSALPAAGPSSSFAIAAASGGAGHCAAPKISPLTVVFASACTIPGAHASPHSTERMVHFRELLAPFRGTDTGRDIPRFVVERIARKLRERRIRCVNELSIALVRSVLKETGLGRYTPRAHTILRILGHALPYMSDDVEEELCHLFQKFEVLWTAVSASVAPAGVPMRGLCFQYQFLLHELCLLTGHTQFLPYVPTMKDAGKRQFYLEIFHRVLAILGYAGRGGGGGGGGGGGRGGSFAACVGGAEEGAAGAGVATGGDGTAGVAADVAAVAVSVGFGFAASSVTAGVFSFSFSFSFSTGTSLFGAGVGASSPSRSERQPPVHSSVRNEEEESGTAASETGVGIAVVGFVGVGVLSSNSCFLHPHADAEDVSSWNPSASKRLPLTRPQNHHHIPTAVKSANRANRRYTRVITKAFAAVAIRVIVIVIAIAIAVVVVVVVVEKLPFCESLYEG